MFTKPRGLADAAPTYICGSTVAGTPLFADIGGLSVRIGLWCNRAARPSSMTVAIVHDYLTQRGGAERVVLSLVRAFERAPVHTALYEPESTFPEFAKLDVRPLYTNRLVL